MNFFERRRWHKIVKHTLHEARHARHMREDVASRFDLDALLEAERGLEAAWKQRDPAVIERAVEGVGAKLDRVSPRRPQPRIRENVEIIAVALAVAMGFRTYFIQPFKIPTGSMQPTLFGVFPKPDAKKELMDYFPLSVVRLVLFGERYVEIRARASGAISLMGRTEDSNVYLIGKARHKIRHGLQLYPLNSPIVRKGQLLASGLVRQGDHIFVNKVLYNFRRPRRGDIFVFSTDHIQDTRIRKDTFYIKRLAGLPGETLAIDPPHLVVNGEKIESPYPFHRLAHETEKGYMGYQLPGSESAGSATLATRDSRLALGPDEYLPLGDNTASSLDGRYFGAVKQQSIVGPAFMVYWPFGGRWGLVQ
jgi:signal peptidase I